MNIGIIGLGKTGQELASRLLHATAHDLWAYDPDGRRDTEGLRYCVTAAEVCAACGVLFLALESESDQMALLNEIRFFFRKKTVVLDLTQISPALAHKNANAFRRLSIGYLDCGIFSAGNGLEEPCLFFVGGSGGLYRTVSPLLRCVVPDCRYMGPAGRGQAVRLFCRALSAKVQRQVEESADLAASFGIPREIYLGALEKLPEISAPLGALGGGTPSFPYESLKADEKIVEEMARRAKKAQAESLRGREKKPDQ